MLVYCANVSVCFDPRLQQVCPRLATAASSQLPPKPPRKQKNNRYYHGEDSISFTPAAHASCSSPRQQTRQLRALFTAPLQQSRPPARRAPTTIIFNALPVVTKRTRGYSHEFKEEVGCPNLAPRLFSSILTYFSRQSSLHSLNAPSPLCGWLE